MSENISLEFRVSALEERVSRLESRPVNARPESALDNHPDTVYIRQWAFKRVPADTVLPMYTMFWPVRLDDTFEEYDTDPQFYKRSDGKTPIGEVRGLTAEFNSFYVVDVDETNALRTSMLDELIDIPFPKRPIPLVGVEEEDKRVLARYALLDETPDIAIGRDSGNSIHPARSSVQKQVNAICGWDYYVVIE